MTTRSQTMKFQFGNDEVNIKYNEKENDKQLTVDIEMKSDQIKKENGKNELLEKENSDKLNEEIERLKKEIKELNENYEKLKKENENFKKIYQSKTNILQVYPHKEVKNQLNELIKNDEFAKEKFHIDSVSIESFNKNPYGYLKLGNNWNYDIILFGAWDAYAGKPLEESAVDAIKVFIEDGRGCIMCHDTIGSCWGDSGYGKLRKYFGIKIGTENYNLPEGDYDDSWGYFSKKIKIKKEGPITSEPWKIGELETVIYIPETHTTTNAALKENVWFELIDGNYYFGNSPPELPEEYSDTFYLSVNDNCAMIQIGHSINASTPDNFSTNEKKILINLIFYLDSKIKK